MILPSSDSKNNYVVTLQTYLLVVIHKDSGSKTPDYLMILYNSAFISIDNFLDSYPLIEVSTLKWIWPYDGLSDLGAIMSSKVFAKTTVLPSFTWTPPFVDKNPTFSFLKSKSSRPSGLNFLEKQSNTYVF